MQKIAGNYKRGEPEDAKLSTVRFEKLHVVVLAGMSSVIPLIITQFLLSTFLNTFTLTL